MHIYSVVSVTSNHVTVHISLPNCMVQLDTYLSFRNKTWILESSSHRFNVPCANYYYNNNVA